MTIETATYISDLNATYPTNSDAKSEGDDHLRLIKSTVKATFPNVAGAVSATHTQLNYVTGVTSAIQTQIDAKAPIASPTFTGTPAAPTAAVDTNTTQVATTAFVIGQGYAKLASPTFTGTVTAAALTTTGNTILGDATTDTLNVGNGGIVKDASGNVGMGIASPTGHLHVKNTDDADYLIVDRSTDQVKVSMSSSAMTLSGSGSAKPLDIKNTGSGAIRLHTDTLRLQLSVDGDVITTLNTSPPALSTNQQMVFAMTSNTNLRISVRGVDGTTRVANITLA